MSAGQDRLRAAMDAALAALDAAPDGWLPLRARRLLREAFGPWTVWQDPAWPNAGSLRRAELYVACSRRVLPVWEQAFPEDRRARRIVDMVMPVLHAERPDDELHALVEEHRRVVDPLGAVEPVVMPDQMRVFCAGETLVSLNWMAFDGDSDPEFYRLEDEDSDLDEPHVDNLAMWALAGEDPDARRAFWRWYITEACPAAYAAVPDDPRAAA